MIASVLFINGTMYNIVLIVESLCSPIFMARRLQCTHMCGLYTHHKCACIHISLITFLFMYENNHDICRPRQFTIGSFMLLFYNVSYAFVS